MNTTAIRDKLQNYIRVADDRKVRAIYTMLEGNMADEMEWWKDDVFISKLEKEFNTWSLGKGKGYSKNEIDRDIEKRRKKRITK